MRLLTFVIVFFLLELFLIVMAAVDYGWVIFWIEVGTAILGAFLIKRARRSPSARAWRPAL